MWKSISRKEISRLKKEGLPVSINDVRDKYFNGDKLTKEERLALTRYDEYRIWYLNSSIGEGDFHKRYEELQAKANLSDFREFLKGRYNLPKQ